MLIITDGAITDFPVTTDEIVKLSQLPVSIIIVGVGKGPFGQMEKLDGDKMILRDGDGQACARDIVQFVPFIECCQKGDLAEQVLKEVPS